MTSVETRARVACCLSSLCRPGLASSASRPIMARRGDTFDATTHRSKADRSGTQNQMAAHEGDKAFHSNRAAHRSARTCGARAKPSHG